MPVVLVPVNPNVEKRFQMPYLARHPSRPEMSHADYVKYTSAVERIYKTYDTFGELATKYAAVARDLVKDLPLSTEILDVLPTIQFEEPEIDDEVIEFDNVELHTYLDDVVDYASHTMRCRVLGYLIYTFEKKYPF